MLFISPVLCGSGASKLIGNGETFLEMVVQCMENSQPHSVRIEGFKLAQCLVVMTATYPGKYYIEISDSQYDPSHQTFTNFVRLIEKDFQNCHVLKALLEPSSPECAN